MNLAASSAAVTAARAEPESGARNDKADQRLCFIQGLRGIAATAVAVFHCYYATPVSGDLRHSVAGPVDSALNLGFLGVDLFFLISGFVIALTLYGRLFALSEYGRFFLRRQVRLDPPYWTAIAVTIASAIAVNRLRPGTNAPVPSVTDVVAHLFYAQGFLGIRPIAGIFWTLCLEIQFYLFFGALVLAAARARLSGAAFAWLLLPLYAYSIACFWELTPAPDALFIKRWFEFFTGVVLFLTYRRQISPWQLLVYLLLLIGIQLANPRTDNGIADVTTATVLLVGLIFWYGIESGGVRHWLGSPVWRYLGDISYSLYLTHAIIGIRLLKIIVHPDEAPQRVWLLYFAALGASLLAADLLFRTIERPSMRLAARLKWRSA